MVGCLGSTYGSLEKLDNDYFLSSKTKSRLLNPTSSKAAWIKSLWFSVDFDHVTPPKYYQCSGPGGLDCKPCYQRSSNYVTDVYESPCPVCKRQMTMKVEYTGEEKGFVKDAMPYIIMDDLSVSPMSTASTITLLSKFSVRDVSCLEERIVRLRRKEALGLLKASLQSKTVLTDVFLRK
ncbi:GTPase obg [Rhynchospora pubera]|uniref:GTPase obg n=1 Tax=Rhynchospora pubera TaxID=906938 RepID=A0AAV8DZJ4_9POAL|nr:GTPase obg [Rhynchospora pubera]